MALGSAASAQISSSTPATVRPVASAAPFSLLAAGCAPGSALRRSARQLMAPYTEGGGFFFCAVKG